MSAAHTPGPWYADKLQDRGAFNIFPAGATLALLQVAGPAHYGAHPYALAAEANARLIAAAPELLAAAQKAESLIPHLDDMDSSHTTASVVAALRAAIAKATGEKA